MSTRTRNIRALFAVARPGRWLVILETWTRVADTGGNWRLQPATTLGRFWTYRAAIRAKIQWQEQQPSRPSVVRYYTITHV